MLKEQCLEVSSAQVSTTLKAMGMRRTRRGKADAVATARTANRSESISIHDLIAAKKLVEQLGGIDHAKTVVSALAKLS